MCRHNPNFFRATVRYYVVWCQEICYFWREESELFHGLPLASNKKMKKPIIRKYSGRKKKTQRKLFFKRTRKEGKNVVNENDAKSRFDSLKRDRITYSFFENFYYQELYNSDVDEYYFSSTRKGYNYYGIIIKVFKNNIGYESDSSELIYSGEGIKLFRTIFDGNNYKDFSKHIKYLGQEEYVLKFKDMDGIYGIGTYPYTAIELQFYINGKEKIGSFYNQKLYEVIIKEFYESRLKYFSLDSFVLFCSLEQIPLRNEYVALLLSELYDFCYPIETGYYSDLKYGVVEWWRKLDQGGIVDIQSYSKGMNGDLLFRNFPLKQINKKDRIQIFSPAPYGEELRITNEYGGMLGSCYWDSGEFKARILKVNNFKNSGLNYWFLYSILDNQNSDNIGYILGKFKESGIRL